MFCFGDRFYKRITRDTHMPSVAPASYQCYVVALPSFRCKGVAPTSQYKAVALASPQCKAIALTNSK